ncbi:NAD(P)-dependent oxidoreductase [bacterium]|jgi:nucleoside-diphosphate-sugar epimerase|nr:NAD(P)-dependent oxidoreductase [bacterium]
MIYIIGGGGFLGSAFVRFCQKNLIDYISISRKNYSKYIGTSCQLLINANGNSKKYMADRDEVGEFDASVRSVKSSLIDFHYDYYVHMSSCDVYDDCNGADTLEDSLINLSKVSNYGFHKYLAELCVQKKADNWLIFRMGGFVGPQLKKNAIFDIIEGHGIWVNPESEFQFLHTDDAAKIVFNIVNKGIYNEIFNLAGNGTIKIKDVIKISQRKALSFNSAIKVAYNVPTDKIKKHADIPCTLTTIENFMNNTKKII